MFFDFLRGLWFLKYLLLGVIFVIRYFLEVCIEIRRKCLRYRNYFKIYILEGKKIFNI